MVVLVFGYNPSNDDYYVHMERFHFLTVCILLLHLARRRTCMSHTVNGIPDASETIP